MANSSKGKVDDVRENKTEFTTSDFTYRDSYDNASISLWREDFTHVYEELNTLRQAGVTDLAAYLDDNPEFCWRLSSMVKVIEVNQATLELFNARDQQQFINNIHLSFGEGAILVFERALIAYWEQQPKFTARANYIRSDGSSFIATISYNIPKFNEAANNVIVAIQDISEEIKNETRLHGILKALPDYSMVLDKRGTILEILSNHTSLFNLAAHDVLSRPINNLLPGNAGQQILATVQNAITMNAIRTVEFRINSAHDIYWFIGRITPINSVQQHEEQVIFVATDITDQKNLEIEVQNHKKMQAVGTLSGGVAHQLNNLLVPIMGYTELLLRQPDLDGFIIRALTNIQQSSKGASDIIKQLLSFGGISTQQPQLSDLSVLVKDIADKLQATLSDKYTLIVDIHPNVPKVNLINADIEQAINNICHNACDAMPDGGDINISVSSENHHDVTDKVSYSYVVVKVQDHGKGIPLDIIDRIYEPFFTTKGIGEGTGMGLSVVQGIMEHHKGKISIKTQEGLGTSTSLLFPVSKKPASGTSQKQQNHVYAADKTILLVDDNNGISN